MLIDLDRPPAPSRPRPTRARPKKRIGLLGVALLLLLVGGAVPPGSYGLWEAGVTNGREYSDYLVTATALLTAGETAIYTVSATESAITAMPLVPGGPHWSVPVHAGRPTLAGVGGTIVVSPTAQGEVTFLDARTGRERWHAPEFAVVRVLGDRVAVWTSGADDEAGLLRMADLATGRTRWQTRTPVAILDGDDDRLLAVDPLGIGTVYATADGKVLVQGRDLGIDPYGWAVPGTERYSAESVLGGTLYVQGPAFLGAYRLPGLTPAWRAKIEEPSVLSLCAGVLCATGPSGVTALDPATGRTLWSNGRWRSVNADAVATAGDFSSVRIDPRTGRARRELGRGAPVGGLMVLFDRDRAWVTGLADGRVRGVLPLVVPSSCETAGELLACPTAGATVTVWRVRP